MSRSRRKHPVITENQRREGKAIFWKRLANKAVRRTDLDSGGAYKKVFNPYHICDWYIDNWRKKEDWWFPSWQWYRK